MTTSPLIRLTFLSLLLLLQGCIYEAPLTEKPTRKIDEHLLGDWLESDDKTKHMVIFKLNDSEYIVEYDKILYRGFHSELEGLHLLSAQNVSATKDDDRRYAFMTYEVQEDGKKLVLRTINQKTIPETLRTTAELQQAIRKNIKNPQLFNEETGVFVKP